MTAAAASAPSAASAPTPARDSVGRRVAASALCVLPVLATADAHLRYYTLSHGIGNVFTFVVESATWRGTVTALSFAALAAATAWSFTRARWRPYVLAPLLGIAYLLAAGAAWRPVATERIDLGAPVAAQDGHVYRSAVFHGGRYLTRERDVQFRRTVVDVVAVRTLGNAPPVVIRPAGDDRTDGLRAGPDGRIWDVALNGDCRLGFDPRTVAADPSHVGVKAEDVSPFALLTDRGEGSERDTARVLEAIRAVRDGTGPVATRLFHAPPERFLVAALSDPNPWVRDTARRLIAEGGPALYPEATKRL